MTPALWLFFRRSYFLDANKIPATGPVVIISNHAASFLDAMIMGVKLRRPIHYYVRSDIFKRPFARYIFSKLHMIPIYSRDKDKTELHRNADSFNEGEKVLKDGGLLLIFPEGTSRVEKNILPLKKGVSRIALQALKKGLDMPLVIVPVGIHYSRHAFRSNLQLVTGDPVPIDHYREQYAENQPKAISQLTQELEKHFRKVVLFVDQPQRTSFVEHCLRMNDNDRGRYFTMADFFRQKNICNIISNLNDEAFKSIEQKQSNYISALAGYNVYDRSFTGKPVPTVPPLLLMLCFPIFGIGIMLNVWPYLVGRKTADKKVTRIDFYTSVQVAVTAIVYFVWILLWIIVSIIFSSPLIALICVLAPFLAWFALWWADCYRDWTYQQEFEKLQRDEPAKILELKTLRMELMNF